MLTFVVPLRPIFAFTVSMWTLTLTFRGHRVPLEAT